jgi:hypothetical protein
MPNTSTFTLEEINQILDQLNEHPGARLQYIGSRYVPILGRKGDDSIEWDNSGTYEPLTIVLYQGNSYTSRQFVPVGIEITNQDYWANTGNYNPQIEQYRQEVAQVVSDNAANKEAIAEANTAIENETQAREQADTTINKAIANETQERKSADAEISATIPPLPQKPIANVRRNDFALEFDSSANRYRQVADPRRSIQLDFFNPTMTNFFPILNGYLNATNLTYGTDFTGTNVNSDYTWWEGVTSHQNPGGTYNIDCMTLVLMVALGIYYNDSVYNAKFNTPNCPFVDMFSEPVKNYIQLAAEMAGLDDTPPSERRLLTYTFAKMAYDAGKLIHVWNTSAKWAVLQVGDIVFFSNSDEDDRFANIGHCAIVSSIINKKVIVADSREAGVSIRQLSDAELNQINWKMKLPNIPQQLGSPVVTQLFELKLTANKDNTYKGETTGAYALITNVTGSRASITIKLSYKETPITNETVTLPDNTSLMIVVPCQCSIALNPTIENINLVKASYPFTIGMRQGVKTV